MWVDSITLDYLNSFRENIFVSQGFPISSFPVQAEVPEKPAT